MERKYNLTTIILGKKLYWTMIKILPKGIEHYAYTAGFS